ncbi:LOW QUALITY PROTEIN: 11-beta-hydroxysteroid dehydrogenase type 2 [Pseudoliparis swirei]|uniref:LOW QUALITY PROTEIN: 11-beta-hydroxysteroid dehydrogenase type 2 n=1 Tax=Pseudoliparis swirei TaxID=2059687 RepID=UPI0024BE45C0|nr:LOW QUALITY PROTEIN: 11-beta-hydroxysteroid dehydrogenase type 2 [Pseudoliparis swirei]
MDGYALPFWIYLGVLSVLVGGAMKKMLASHLGPAPPLVAWLGAAVLAERLWAVCPPVALLLGEPAACTPASRHTCYASSSPGHKAVLITGCDSGFGHATAKYLDAIGFEVFATVLDLSGGGARELQRRCSPRLTLLQVDITQPHQVQQALMDTEAKLGLRGQSSDHAYWERQHQQRLQSLPAALLQDYGEDYLAETKELFQDHAGRADPDLGPVTDAVARALLSPRPQVRYLAGRGVGLMYFIHSYCPVSLSSRFLQRLFLRKELLPRALRGRGSELDRHNNNNEEEKEEEQEE